MFGLFSSNEKKTKPQVSDTMKETTGSLSKPIPPRLFEKIPEKLDPQTSTSSELLQGIFKLLIRNDSFRKLEQHEAQSRKEELEEEEERRHQEIIDALSGKKKIGATKVSKASFKKPTSKKLKKEPKTKKQIADSQTNPTPVTPVTTPEKPGLVSTILGGARAAVGLLGKVGVAGIGLSLSSAIARGESAKGSYNAANMGTKNNKIVPIKEKINLEDMTIGEIMQRQSIKWGDPNENQKLFAVGKYQMIPETLADAVKTLNIDKNAKFTSSLQERMFDEYLLGQKRPQIAAYLNSPTDDPLLLHSAIKALSLEWASVADPDIPGGKTSHYGSGNIASLSVKDATEILKSDREKIMKEKNKSSIRPLLDEPGKTLTMFSQENNNIKKELTTEASTSQTTINNTNMSGSVQTNGSTGKQYNDTSPYQRKKNEQ